MLPVFGDFRLEEDDAEHGAIVTNRGACRGWQAAGSIRRPLVYTAGMDKTTYVSTYLGNRFYPLQPRIDKGVDRGYRARSGVSVPVQWPDL